MNNNYSLSVVIPTYNEEKRIDISLQKIRSYLDEKEYDYEVIVSDDGSKDNTVKILKEYQKTWNKLVVLENLHRGKAPALISGINKASKENIYMADADLSVNIDEVSKMLNWVTEHDYQVVIATREGVGAQRINEPYMRHFMGRIFNLLVQILVLPGINDTQCGFKLFKSEAGKEICKNTLIYSDNDPEINKGRVGAYDVEILYVAKCLGYKIKEVPVVWTYGENSKVHKFKDSYYNAKDVFKVKLNSLKGLYPKK
jgi:dolichyl-phosphate beta-glucosyltransferase